MAKFPTSEFSLSMVGALITTKLLYDTLSVTLLFESILVSTLLLGIFKILQTYRRNQSWKQTKQELPRILLVVLLVFNLMFFSLMMIDRSKSLYVVRWIGDCPGLSEDEVLIEVRDQLGQFDDQYIRLRIEEQITRSIVNRDQTEKLRLSVFGKTVYFIANSLSNLFGLEGWTRVALAKSPKCV